MIGPVQFLVMGFEHLNPTGEVSADLDRLRDAETARLDVLLVERNDDGTSHTLPFPEGTSERIDTTVADLLGETELADAIPPGTTAAVGLIEHTWAAPLRNAIASAGGTPVEETWLHQGTWHGWSGCSDNGGVPLRKLGFLTIGLFDPAEPREGHETTLEIIELGERLGFDSAWVRHRHLQFGISSPVAVLAAATQRTSTIELGTAVIPLGWENPLRLAEDLATVDVLSGGRLNPGVSVGPPMHWDDVKHALYPDTADVEDFSYERVERLLRFVRGEHASTFKGAEGVVEEWSDRVEPHSPGLADRLWYGGASLRSAEWAADHRMNFLTSSVVKAEDGSTDFAAIQAEQVSVFRERHPHGRVSQGLVVIPTDSATSDQRRRYEEYAEKRLPRTREPQGPGKLLFSPDHVGTSAELAEQLQAHAGYQLVEEVAFALPFSFAPDDYVQILTDMTERLGPALGWSPRGS